MYSSLWIRMWLPWSTSTQHGHVQPVGGRGAGGDDCWVQLWQVSHQPDQGLHHLCPAGVLSYLDQRDGCAGQTAPGHPRESRFAVRRHFFHLFHVFSVLPYRQSRVQVYMVNMYKISSREVSWFPVIRRYHLWDIILSPKPGEHQEFYMFLCFDLAIDNPDYLVQI